MEDPVAALGRIRFILCRTRNPQNLGAAARALRNAGISRWALVDPQTRDFDAARPLAVHAGELLAEARIVPTLREAAEGCALVVGTTARARPERPLLTPREAAARLVGTRGEVAVVFGDERSGLTAGEVDACDLLATLPGAPEQPSWNLAQAVAIFAYEARVAALERPREATPRPEADPGALAAVDRALAAAAQAVEKPGARRRLFRALERARLTAREAALWTAFLRALARRE